MKARVDVSILSANYNNGDFLEDYFNSILNSSVFPLELILVEDGSDDGSAGIIERFSHLDFLHLIRHEKRKGLAPSLNEGMAMASGKYLMRLDPDDFISTERIEAQYGFLEENPGIDIVGSDVYYYNDNRARVVFRSKFPVSVSEIQGQYRKGYHGLVHSAVMGRTDVLKRYTFSQKAFPAEEYDLFSRMCLQNVGMANIPRPLTYYRIHNRNITREKVKTSVKLTNSLRNDLFLVPATRGGNWIRIQHLYYYRKALGARNRLSAILFFAISIVFCPAKILKRFF